ncbi:hypothetical protein K435DRAFT_782680 [Dendrothele bispora CBS 962.96]|uniref:Epidermal growth factor receptor-like transmembrane-juxtamembrane segment domain-containing protein n=1 Tax=Dendrothele bispora (strain CBS 962.96) TaxID=1314807 RepID=A0A4S8LEA0_DENBC|nr:hypothetical protein K435DRAFT_782680 [Dendrothele bispora CBS 962.96]
MGTVWKMVDDTNSGIEYTGDWRPSFGNDIIDGVGVSLNDSGHSVIGPVFNNTVHSVLTAGTSLKFRFNGTSHAAIYGSNVRTPDLSGSFVTECLLDNVSVETDGSHPGPINLPLTPTDILVRNNQVLCRSGEAKSNLVVPGEHELVFNVLNTTGTTAGLFVDYIVYETLPDASVDGDILQMGNGDIDFPANRDQHLSFTPGWVETARPFANIFTYTPGSSVTVKFNGTGIQLYGEFMGQGTQLALNPMIYQLDDQDPMVFQLFPFGDGLNRTHQILFDIHSLSPDEHTVVVTHNGTASGMPLIVDYFQVTSLTSDEQASLSSGMPSSLPSPPPRHQQKSAIIGGAVGGALLFSLVAVGAVIFLWKRNRQRQRKETTGSSPLYVESSGADFDPYSLESSFHTRTNKPTTEGSNSHDTSLTPTEDINVVRTRNLKLQQRLTVLQTAVSGNRHAEQSPITHTDSGWRMREEGRQELPPTYAEA